MLTGGKRMPGAGNYYPPTVLADVPRSADVYREELFGPVAMLFRVRDIDDAIRWPTTRRLAWPLRCGPAARPSSAAWPPELRCGAVFINEVVASDPRLPFGGVKRSGYGRELSAAGMREFLNAKTVVIAEPVSAKPPESARLPSVAPSRRCPNPSARSSESATRQIERATGMCRP